MHIRLLTEPERAKRQHLTVGLPEDLKTVMGQRARHDPDLNADRFFFHQCNQVLGFGLCLLAAFGENFFGEIEPSYAVAGEVGYEVPCDRDAALLASGEPRMMLGA